MTLTPALSQGRGSPIVRAALLVLAALVAMGASEAKVRRAFELTRHDGVAVTDRSFHGKPMLVFFGFTTCPDVCPMGLAAMAQAARRLEKAGIEVTPVFITVDPDRDTPQLLSQYVKEFHPRMVGLTGSTRNVSHAAAAFGVQFGVKKNDATYYVWHSSHTYLVGSRGELLETFAPYATAQAIADGSRRALGARYSADRTPITSTRRTP